MAKSRKRKKKRYHPNPAKPPARATNADALVILISWLVGCTLIIVGVILAAIQYIDLTRGRRPAVSRWFITVLIVTILALLMLGLRGTKDDPKLIVDGKVSVKGMKKSRKQGVRQMRLAVFLLIAIVIESLFFYGYMRRLTAWLQQLSAFRWISQNYLFGISYVLGAIVSGVLGNVSYAALRGLVRKLYHANSLPPIHRPAA